jgi:replicative DNA helicase
MNAPVRNPPTATEAEETVLMLNPNDIDRVRDHIRPDSFYSRLNRAIFGAICTLHDRDGVFDAPMIFEFLKTDLDVTVTVGDLSELTERSFGTANIDHHAKLIRDAHTKRQALAATHEIADRIYSAESLTGTDAIDFAEHRIMQIGEQARRGKSGLQHASTGVRKTLEEIQRRAELGGGLVGLSTGFIDLDKITSGLQPSDLIVIAGRPSMGKTTLAMNISLHASIKSSVPVAFFSMEMSEEQLHMRNLAALSLTDLNKIRQGSDLNDADWSRITNASVALDRSSKLYIDETGALTPGEVRSRARRLHSESGGLGLIVIDYLQLMQTESKENNRTTQITEITNALKALAKELNVPVVVLSQLNRSLEQRSDRRPVMSDLRESGSIEQDADVIAFVYRDEVYDSDSQWKGTAEILIRKQRQGATGMVRLAFKGAFTKFDNYASTTDAFDELGL